MWKVWRVWLVGVLVLSATAGSAAQKSSFEVPLKFIPQDATIDASVSLPAAMLGVPVEIRLEDGRVLTDVALIGERANGSSSIRAAGDVIQFVKEAVTNLAGARGLKAATPGARQLRIRLIRFWIVESHRTVGSNYAAEAQFTYVLTDGSGRPLVDGTASATAGRYGKAGSADNIAELLSGALKEAVLNTLADSRLHAAWISGEPPKDVVPAPPTTAPPTGKPVELKVGMSEAEAIAALGQPVRRITMTDRTLLQYADLVLTIVGGKVTDIQVK